jgi:hypothetical protein
MRRREFVRLLGGSALAWPLSARAQQPRMLRVGFVGIQPREVSIYVPFLKRMAHQEDRNFTFEYIRAPSIEGYEASYNILLAVGNEPSLRSARAVAGALYSRRVPTSCSSDTTPVHQAFQRRGGLAAQLAARYAFAM